METHADVFMIMLLKVMLILWNRRLEELETVDKDIKVELQSTHAGPTYAKDINVQGAAHVVQLAKEAVEENLCEGSPQGKFTS
ncbi:hypothetical protein R6Q59_023577 [Mikania micrantha]